MIWTDSSRLTLNKSSVQTHLTCMVVRKEVGKNLIHFEATLNGLFEKNQHLIGHVKLEPILWALVLE